MFNREVFIGIIVGIVANFIGLILTIIFLHENSSISEVIYKSYEEEFLNKLISLGAIMNLIVFFYFIKKRKDNVAKGILLMTIIIALFTLTLNYNII